MIPARGDFNGVIEKCKGSSDLCRLNYIHQSGYNEQYIHIMCL